MTPGANGSTIWKTIRLNLDVSLIEEELSWESQELAVGIYALSKKMFQENETLMRKSGSTRR